MSTFPLNQLKPSPQNVRKTGGASIADIAASIKHHGLIHPLSVTTDGLVVAGGRRLQALQLLAKEGHFTDDHPVPCTVISHNQATEISLAENVMREAMHPADEFDAYQRLVTEDKLTPAEIAERYGVTERHVQQRLRLANLAPLFIRLYRDGNASQEQLMALSVTDNAEAQLEAWKAGEHHSYYRSPERLRDALLEKEITSEDAVPVFVGIDAYRAAGGKVREDLFSDVVVLLDGALVNRLAQAKLQAEADKVLAKGWGWAEARIEWYAADRAKYKQAPGKEPSALLGVIVTLSSSGKVEVHAGLVKPGQKAPANAKPQGQAKQQPRKADPMKDANAKLEGIRLGLVRKAMRQDPDAALSVLAAALCTDRFNVRGDLVESISEVGGMPFHSASDSEAVKAIDPSAIAAQTRWKKDMDAGIKKHGSVLQWLLSSPRAVVFDLLEFLAVEAIEPTEGYVKEGAASMHRAIQLLGVTLTDHWQLTAGWLQAQGKPYILAALEDALGKGKSAPYAKLKTNDLPDQAEKALLAAGWLPEPMRAPAPKPKTPAKKAATKKNGAKK